MNTKNSKLATLLALPVLLFGLNACDVDQTQEGEMPEVEVEGGQMPKYDVEAADVDVEMEKKTIEVPDVDVEMKEKEISVPKMNVTMPDEKPQATVEETETNE